MQWTGTNWSSIPGFPLATSGIAMDLVVHDDGSGPALIVAGWFPALSGLPSTQNIFSWNGTAFSSLAASPHPDPIHRLYSFDPDGPGGPQAATLFALGRVMPGSPDTANIGRGYLDRLDGSTWTRFYIPGATCANGYFAYLSAPEFRAVAAFDSGTGPALHLVDGNSCDGVQEMRLLRFDGSGFTPLGNPIVGGSPMFDGEEAVLGRPADALCMHIHDFGQGPTLLCAGYFEGTPNEPSSGIVKWSDGQWRAFTPPGGPHRALPNDPVGFFSLRPSTARVAAPFDPDGPGPMPSTLAVGGTFNRAGPIASNIVAAWDGAAWSDLGGSGFDPDAQAIVSLATFPVAGVPTLHASVARLSLDGPPTAIGGVYRRVSGAWEPIASISSTSAPRLLVADLGQGPVLVAFGAFTFDSGESNLAVWNGAAWTQVPVLNSVATLAVADDGSGPTFFASFGLEYGGFGTTVEKWNGTFWESIAESQPPFQQDRCPLLQLADSHKITAFRGQIIDIRTDFRVLAWQGDSWGVLTELPLGPDNTNGCDGDGYNAGIIGVADPGLGDGDRLYGWLLSDLVNSMGYTLLEFDGTSWTPIGFAVSDTNPPNSVFRADIGGRPGVCFTGMRIGVSPTVPTTTVSADGINCGSEIARFFLPAPPCIADFNASGAVTVQDIFDFLAAYFNGSPAADVNNSAGITVQDIFDFLSLYFQGC